MLLESLALELIELISREAGCTSGPLDRAGRCDTATGKTSEETQRGEEEDEKWVESGALMELFTNQANSF